MEEYNKDDNKPILVQFENGPLKDELKSSVQFEYFRSSKSHKRMLVADCGTVMYTGNVLQKQQSLVKYYVGVVDKSTGRIEDVQGVQLCTLKPKLREECSPAKKVASQDLTFRQKSDTLVEAFGSAKQKRLVSARRKNENVHESISEKVASAAQKILVDSPKASLAPGTDEGTDSQILVPKNLDAKTLYEVYNIDDVIPYPDKLSLLGLAKEMTYFEESTLLSWKNEKKYPLFILRCLKQLSELSTATKQRKEKGCYICYLNYLIKFDQVMDYKRLKQVHNNSIPGIPDQLKESLLDRFTHADSDSGKFRCRPQKYKDKLYCYIFVLALFIEDFDMNCNLLVKDLKLGLKRVQKLLRVIGCTITTANLYAKSPSKEGTAPPEPVIRAVLRISNDKVKSGDGDDLLATPTTNTNENCKMKMKEEPIIKKEPE